MPSCIVDPKPRNSDACVVEGSIEVHLQIVENTKPAQQVGDVLTCGNGERNGNIQPIPEARWDLVHVSIRAGAADAGKVYLTAGLEFQAQQVGH